MITIITTIMLCWPLHVIDYIINYGYLFAANTLLRSLLLLIG